MALDACDPDLALVDITLPDKSGLELIKDIKALRPGLPILVVSMHEAGEALETDVGRDGSRLPSSLDDLSREEAG